MDQVIIRKAKRQDCKDIMRLIHELAEFEKLPDHVKIDSSDLERDGFDTDSPKFECYVAEMRTDAAEESGEQSTRLVGYALYFKSYSTWQGLSLYLEDIYVSPQCRGHGTGMALFKQVAKECVTVGGKRLEFEVLDWNPARTFYEKLGAEDQTEKGGWHKYRVTGEALKNLGSCVTR